MIQSENPDAEKDFQCFRALFKIPTGYSIMLCHGNFAIRDLTWISGRINVASSNVQGWKLCLLKMQGIQGRIFSVADPETDLI